MTENFDSNHFSTVEKLHMAFDDVLDAATTIFVEKNNAYGTENIAEIGLHGVVSRMRDKFSRLKQLGADAVGDYAGESVNDTLYDIINYAVILLLLRGNEWPGQRNTERDTVTDPEEMPSDPPFRDTTPAVLVLRDEAHSCGIHEPQLDGDVGFDLFAAKDTELLPRFHQNSWEHGKPVYVPTGVRMKMPPGTWAMIIPRSSTSRRGIRIPPNVIDNGYTGELMVPCINETSTTLNISAFDRIAQVVFFPSVIPTIEMVDELPGTARASAGFGSTGT